MNAANKLRRVEERKKLHRMFHGKCAYCGRDLPFSDMTVDHVIPLAKGGTSSIQNMVPACIQCNNRKGMLTIQGFRRSIKKSVAKAFEIPVLGMLEAFDLITVNNIDVVFYFEKLYGIYDKYENSRMEECDG